jgi:hypothetical protein
MAQREFGHAEGAPLNPGQELVEAGRRRSGGGVERHHMRGVEAGHGSL